MWAMLHNPEDYPEPESFKPERYLDSDGNIDPRILDPTRMAFGFGRRYIEFSVFFTHISSSSQAEALLLVFVLADISPSIRCSF